MVWSRVFDLSVAQVMGGGGILVSNDGVGDEEIREAPCNSGRYHACSSTGDLVGDFAIVGACMHACISMRGEQGMRCGDDCAAEAPVARRQRHSSGELGASEGNAEGRRQSRRLY